MKFAVMATGGIGGYYGGLLAKDGQDVTFVARGTHLGAICENGLRVKSIHGDFDIAPAKATDQPATIGPVDYVLFGVKTYDTEPAAEAIKPIVGPKTTVVTFQNGVESYEQLGAILGREHVLFAPTQIVTFIAAPGQIQQASQFRVITLGEMSGTVSQRVEQLASLFRPHGVEVIVTQDLPRAVWSKFLRLASLGLCTLARTAPYDLFQSEEARQVLQGAMREILAVGRAEGVDVGDDEVKRAVDWVLALKPGQKPSMLTDLERGNRLEIDALSGAVVRLGKKHGISTPIHQTIYVALKPVDERNRLAREKG